MPGPAIAAVAGSVGSAVIGSKSAGAAADAARGTAVAQNAETRRQFDLIQKLMKPYVNAGNVALQAQLDLMGIGGSQGATPAIEAFSNGAWGPASAAQPAAGNGSWAGSMLSAIQNGGRLPTGTTAPTAAPGGMGYRVGGKTFATMQEAQAYAEAQRTGGVSAADAQKNAIAALANGEQFKALADQGEYALMANSAATGGLRGGDTAAAMAQFRPQMLQSLIDRQLANLGGVAANGQSAAGGVGSAAQNTAGMISQNLGGYGQAQMGASLARGQAWQNGGADILSSLSGMAQKFTPGGGLWQGWKF